MSQAQLPSPGRHLVLCRRDVASDGPIFRPTHPQEVLSLSSKPVPLEAGFLAVLFGQKWRIVPQILLQIP